MQYSTLVYPTGLCFPEQYSLFLRNLGQGGCDEVSTEKRESSYTSPGKKSFFICFGLTCIFLSMPSVALTMSGGPER